MDEQLWEDGREGGKEGGRGEGVTKAFVSLSLSGLTDPGMEDILL